MAKSLNRHIVKATYDFSKQKTATSSSSSLTVATNQFIIASHGFETGDSVSISGTLSLSGAGSVAINTQYFIIRVNANTFSLASSLALAKAGTALVVTGTYQSMVVVGNAVGTFTFGPKIPKGAIIVNAFINVTTTLVGASATIGVFCNSAGDLVAALAIASWPASSSTPPRLGTLAGTPATGGNSTSFSTGTALLLAAADVASYVVVTASVPLSCIIATTALSAGAFDVYVEYIY